MIKQWMENPFRTKTCRMTRLSDCLNIGLTRVDCSSIRWLFTDWGGPMINVLTLWLHVRWRCFFPAMYITVQIAYLLPPYCHNSTSENTYLGYFSGLFWLQLFTNFSSCRLCDIPHTVWNLADRRTIVVKLEQCVEKTRIQAPVRTGMHYVAAAPSCDLQSITEVWKKSA